MSQSATALSQLASDFRGSLRGLASTVSLLTTEKGGERFGMVATAVMPVTLQPPALVVGVNCSASIHDAIAKCGWFAVNLLAKQHEVVSRHFTANSRSERFAVGNWADLVVASSPEVRMPVLTDAAAMICCRVREIIPYGTHDLFLSTVEQVTSTPNSEPLLYCNGSFGSFNSPP
jgi:flavin reductase (DIM6/NTAB) family NADH-FMN oxidoreductase RutF